MKKLEDWSLILEAAIAARYTQQFRRGKSDCVMTVADIVFEYTGTDLVNDLRGTYASDREALRLIRGFEGGMVGEFKRRCASFGLSEIPVIQATRGDLAFLLPNNSGSAWEQGAGIFLNFGVISVGRVGFVTVSRSAAAHAWRIE